MKTKKTKRVYVDFNTLVPMVRRAKYWDIMWLVIAAMIAVEWLTGGADTEDTVPFWIFWPCLATIMVLAYKYSNRWAKVWILDQCRVKEEEIVVDKED